MVKKKQQETQSKAWHITVHLDDGCTLSISYGSDTDIRGIVKLIADDGFTQFYSDLNEEFKSFAYYPPHRIVKVTANYE